MTDRADNIVTKPNDPAITLSKKELFPKRNQMNRGVFLYFLEASLHQMSFHVDMLGFNVFLPETVTTVWRQSKIL